FDPTSEPTTNMKILPFLSCLVSLLPSPAWAQIQSGSRAESGHVGVLLPSANAFTADGSGNTLIGTTAAPLITSTTPAPSLLISNTHLPTVLVHDPTTGLTNILPPSNEHQLSGGQLAAGFQPIPHTGSNPLSNLQFNPQNGRLSFNDASNQVFNQQSGFIQQPGFIQQSSFNQQPGFIQQSSFNQQPGFIQQPDFNQQTEFNQQAGFNQGQNIAQQQINPILNVQHFRTLQFDQQQFNQQPFNQQQSNQHLLNQQQLNQQLLNQQFNQQQQGLSQQQGLNQQQEFNQQQIFNQQQFNPQQSFRQQPQFNLQQSFGHQQPGFTLQPGVTTQHVLIDEQVLNQIPGFGHPNFNQQLGALLVNDIDPNARLQNPNLRAVGRDQPIGQTNSFTKQPQS
ncbi:unnamed protein product, partial [Meganyctiphanes norvegica]